MIDKMFDDHVEWLDATITTAFNLDRTVDRQPDDMLEILRNPNSETTVVVILRQEGDTADAWWCQAGSDDDVMVFHNIKVPTRCVRVRLPS